jgi:hypothetical protein
VIHAMDNINKAIGGYDILIKQCESAFEGCKKQLYD